MSDTIFFLLSIGPLAVVLVLIASQRATQVHDAYAGEVTGRWVERSYGTYGMTTRCVMRIRTDEGREVTIRVDGRTYRSLGVGDRVFKAQGARWPVRSE